MNGCPSPPVRIGIHPVLDHSLEEIKYVFRTLLRIAGFPCEFAWANSASLDIYYGPDLQPAPPAVLRIAACGLHFREAHRLANVPVIADWDRLENGPDRGDPIFAAYWLLTGAAENTYVRDRWDNLYLDGSRFLEQGLLSRPLVSLYASALRERFLRLGRVPLRFPWELGGRSCVFAFTHDVDYPEIIRFIECLRLLRERGRKAWPSIGAVLRGENHFWKFAQWVDFEQEFDARPAFYFMARKGSLAEYALGTPDAFYDIRSQRFRKLFRYLDGEGCEIGLHASFHAHRGVERLQREKQLLEEQAEVVVAGNRHHYWHLNPDAPNDTLALHEQAGLEYDSSLGFEFYPGFRRGVCHPFRPYHPGLRRELGLVELPPAWMDDHFHRRLRRNGIESPEDHAQQLLNIARATHGAIVVDYHARGMNADFFPQYGTWLMNFMRKHVDAEVAFATPAEIADVYKKHEAVLEAASRDTTGPEVVAPGSPVRVTEFRKEDSAACEAFVEAHPAGNIYHSPAWTAVTEEGLGHCPFYLKATDGAGRITGVLPLFLVKGITGRRLVSVPMRDRGGLLALDRVSGRALLARAVELSHELRCAYLELRSLDEFDAELASEFGLLVTRHWITTRVDLSPGVERLWKALDKNAIRWAINKASRTGMTFEDDESEAGIDLFYDLFVRTRTHMGIPPFPKSLFTAIWRHLIARGKGKLFVVRKQGVPVNAMINLLSGNTFVPAYAAPQNEWRKSYPSEFMIWHSIRWAAERGFTNYDFGADSPHQTGLLQFKKKWGGVQYPVSYVYHLNGRSKPPNFDSSSGAYAAVRQAWRRLPLPVSRSMGSWVTRQLS